MTLEPLGEEAMILRGLPGGEAWKAAKWLSARGIPGLLEANAAWDTVGLYLGENFDSEQLSGELEQMVLDSVEPGRLVEIPTIYDGEDLEMSAGELELSVPEFIELHATGDYTCFAVGFCPGFPYLIGLPEPLVPLPRLSSPRLRVPAGSVAVAAGQCGIYPSERPGGWRLIGRTSLQIANEEAHEYMISAGDRVRFIPEAAR